jgi:hypothetical protein
MTAVVRAIVAALVAVLVAVPVVAQPADDDIARLQEVRRATQEIAVDIGRQLDEIQVRKVDPDWVALDAGDGTYVQVDLKRVDELVPWVQMALADLDAAPAMLRAIARHQPELARAADAAAAGGFLGLAGTLLAEDELEAYRKLQAGDIEGIDSDAIRTLIRDLFAGAGEQQRKADNYAALEADLREQQRALMAIVEVLDAELEALEAPPSEPPTSGPIDGCDPGDAGALGGLCGDWDEQAAVEPTDAEECSETDMWCQDAEGATRESGLAAWEGRWPTNEGLLTLSVVGGRIVGEFEAGSGSHIAGATFTLDPESDEIFSGRWDARVGRYACEDYGSEPGYWGSIWLTMKESGEIWGGFGYCDDVGGYRIHSE